VVYVQYLHICDVLSNVWGPLLACECYFHNYWLKSTGESL
ncbi:unnamed protein product, partial [Coregonus sp. 'balchen']